MEEIYCTVCHGRGFDQDDHICTHCGGQGYEPLDIPENEQSGHAQ